MIKDHLESHFNNKKKKKMQIFACVDICDSDCEITYYNNKIFKSKSLRKHTLGSVHKSGLSSSDATFSKNALSTIVEDNCNDNEKKMKSEFGPCENYIQANENMKTSNSPNDEFLCDDGFTLKENLMNFIKNSHDLSEQTKLCFVDEKTKHRECPKKTQSNELEMSSDVPKSRKKGKKQSRSDSVETSLDNINSVHENLIISEDELNTSSEIPERRKKMRKILRSDAEASLIDDPEEDPDKQSNSEEFKQSRSDSDETSLDNNSEDDILTSSEDEFRISNVIPGNRKKRKKKLRSNSDECLFDDSEEDPEKQNNSEEFSISISGSKVKRKKNQNEECEYGGRDFDIKSLHILLPFEVNPLHSYFSKPSKPTSKELQEVRKAGIKIKSGPFTVAEDQIIRDNWARFCKEHNIMIDPFYFFKFPKEMSSEKRMNFMQYIAHGLENRIPHLIYKRFTRIFRNPWQKWGRFTSEEDKIILDYVSTTKSKKPFYDLSGILNRDSFSIHRRYSCLMQSKQFSDQIIKWDIELIDQFVNTMLRICKLKDVKDLESSSFRTKHWHKLSKKMGIPMIKLQKVWKINIHPRLFACNETDTMKMKATIIKTLYDNKETDWKKINWTEIAKKFTGFTPLKTYMLFRQTVEFHVPKKLHKNLRDTVVWLWKKIKNGGTLYNMKFRRYEYCDGHVRYVNENEGGNKET